MKILVLDLRSNLPSVQNINNLKKGRLQEMCHCFLHRNMYTKTEKGIWRDIILRVISSCYLYILALNLTVLTLKEDVQICCSELCYVQ